MIQVLWLVLVSLWCCVVCHQPVQSEVYAQVEGQVKQHYLSLAFGENKYFKVELWKSSLLSSVHVLSYWYGRV